MCPQEFGRRSTFLPVVPFRKVRAAGLACTRKRPRFFSPSGEKPNKNDRNPVRIQKLFWSPRPGKLCANLSFGVQGVAKFRRGGDGTGAKASELGGSGSSIMAPENPNVPRTVDTTAAQALANRAEAREFRGG